MTHVLVVSARKFGDPMHFVVLMKSDDGLVHGSFAAAVVQMALRYTTKPERSATWL